MMRGRLLTALLFGATAAAFRFALPDVKTRLLILVLIAVAALFELGLAYVFGRKPSLARFLLSAAAIVLAAFAVKIALEGQPRYPSWTRSIAVMIRE